MSAKQHEVRKERDLTVDIIRGISLFLMVGANMLPLLEQPHLTPYRYAASFCAPVFIILAAMMVQLTNLQTKPAHNLSYFTKRGFFILFVAAFIDTFIYAYIPFITVDILYIMGFSMPIIYLITKYKVPTKILYLLIISITISTPLLQNLMNYEVEYTVFDLHFKSSLPFINASNLDQFSWGMLAKNWLMGGDFPLFPFFAYFLFGIILARLRFVSKVDMTARPFTLTALFLTIIGEIAFLLIPGEHLERSFYAEYFYPANIGFIILSLGVALLSFVIIDHLKRYNLATKLLNFFTIFGECPLFIYFTHILIINMVIKAGMSKMNISTMNQLSFQIISLIHVACLFLICLGLRKLKKNWKNMPTYARWFFGS